MNEITITLDSAGLNDFVAGYPDPEYAISEYAAALRRGIIEHYPGVTVSITRSTSGRDTVTTDGDYDDDVRATEVYETVAAGLADFAWLPLNTQQAAGAVGMTTRHIRRLIADGKLPARKLGRDWLIRPGDLAGVERIKSGRPRVA